MPSRARARGAQGAGRVWAFEYRIRVPAGTKRTELNIALEDVHLDVPDVDRHDTVICKKKDVL